MQSKRPGARGAHLHLAHVVAPKEELEADEQVEDGAVHVRGGA